MKALLLAIILGALGYYIFIYDSSEHTQSQFKNTTQTENQKIREEMGIEEKTYQGAMMETYQKYKSAVQGAKDAVSLTESRS